MVTEGIAPCLRSPVAFGESTGQLFLAPLPYSLLLLAVLSVVSVLVQAVAPLLARARQSGLAPLFAVSVAGVWHLRRSEARLRLSLSASASSAETNAFLQSHELRLRFEVARVQRRSRVVASLGANCPDNCGVTRTNEKGTVPKRIATAA